MGQVCANGGETSAKPGIEFPDGQVDETVIADLQAIDHELKRLLLGKQEERNAALVAEFQKDFRRTANESAVKASPRLVHSGV